MPEMPARAEEVHHARQEGIDFQMLTAPVEFLSDGKGWLSAARCVRMELGEPDASGRRRPVPKEGSEFNLPLSVAVIAIGTSANPIVQSTTPGLGTNKHGYIQASEERNAQRAKECSRVKISLPEAQRSFWQWAPDAAPPNRFMSI